MIDKRLGSSIGRTDGLYPSDVGSGPAQGSCEECGTVTVNPRFCSLSCSTKWQAKAKAWRIGYCKSCRRVISLYYNGRKKFCNQSCAALFNKNRLGTGKTSIVVECIQCGKSLNKDSSRYCSVGCQQIFQRDRKLESWLFGNWNGSTKSGASHIIRDFMLDFWDHKCALCGWAEVNPTSGRKPLELEHIDGNYENNSILNLIILCPNCHSLTPTYKALNWGNGRKWRLYKTNS